jgi:hypothetical protein
LFKYFFLVISFNIFLENSLSNDKAKKVTIDILKTIEDLPISFCPSFSQKREKIEEAFAINCIYYKTPFFKRLQPKILL